ncbi:MAG: NAD-dependent epimerase/dehydratase family protein [Solobacterium sp.]|nr:NAD-dependent epimerase/dehydratase family protein [Solobacterium sp.]
MKKILMIGGTGTISLPVTKKLCADRNFEVYVLNRGTHNHVLPENAEVIRGDIHDEEAMKELLKDREFDVVMNFILYTLKDAGENVRLFAGKTKQFIYISTNVVADHEKAVLMNETAEKGNEYSPYGQAKREAEDYLLRQYRENGFPVTVLRPTQTYSEDRLPLSVKGKTYWGVISRILRDKEVIVHGDGESVWAGTHADDFAEACYPVIGNGQTAGEIYYVVNPEIYTWNMLYRTIGEVLHKEVKIVHIPTEILSLSRQYDFAGSVRGDKYYSNVFDISKLRTVNPDLHFRISMRKGIEMYMEYMDAHPEKKKEDPEFDAWCDETIRLYLEYTEKIRNQIR